jgi:hypothetical protein
LPAQERQGLAAAGQVEIVRGEDRFADRQGALEKAVAAVSP